MHLFAMIIYQPEARGECNSYRMNILLTPLFYHIQYYTHTDIIEIIWENNKSFQCDCGHGTNSLELRLVLANQHPLKCYKVSCSI